MTQSLFPIHLQFLLTLIIAVLLQIYPLPDAANLWRPQWMLLAVFYWIQRRPLVYGTAAAFMAGLFLDLVVGVFPGRYALALTLCAYLMVILRKWIRHLDEWHQTFFVILLAWLCGAVVQSVDWLLLGDQLVSRHLVWSAVGSGLAWVIMRLLAGIRFRRT